MSQNKLPKQDPSSASGRYWNCTDKFLEVSVALGASTLLTNSVLVYRCQSGGIVAVFINSIRTHIMEVVDEAV